MSEPKQPDLKMITLVIWIAIVTAILVTLIDWKIKSDILRLTDAFYRTYPGSESGTTRQTESKSDSPPGSILPLPSVDNDAGMEAETILPLDTEEARPTPSSWAEFEARFNAGAAEDSERLQKKSE